MKKDLIPLFPHLIPVEDQTTATLIKCFGERVEDVTEGIRDRLESYFKYLKDARPDDWFLWAMRGISQVATKVTKDQRSIAYLIGIYKMWLSYGFGTYHSLEFTKVKELFYKRFGVELSDKAQQLVTRMISDWGIVFVVSSLMNVDVPQSADISVLICAECEAYMEREFKPIIVPRQN